MAMMLARLRLVRVLTRDGRLAWRLMRDPRTPLKAKLYLAAAGVYLVSPVNLVTEWVPILGQLDDIAVLTLAFEMFFRNIPPWLKAEHEAALGRRPPPGTRIIDI
jgi:uncharacterized membrane protein YkvA (DUF1232 family)